MTQTHSNYQETINTLLFGQKAKNVKTTVNVTEITQRKELGSEAQKELEAAQKQMEGLKKKVEKLQKELKCQKQINEDLKTQND